MGLFGGFKAKFTRNSKSKDNVQEVVCTKYRIFSEFDIPYRLNGSATSAREPPNPAPRQHQVKPKRPLIKSEIYNSDIDILPPVKKTHSLQNINTFSKPPPVPKNSPPPLPKSRPPALILNDYEDPDDNNISFTTNVEVPNNSRSVAFAEMSADRNLIKNHNGDVEETLEIITNNSLYSLGDSYDTFIQKKSVLNSSSSHYYEEMNVGDEPSTLILMTQHSMGNEDHEKYSDKNQSDYTYAYASTYEDDDFKVNVVKHDYSKSTSYSEDEISNSDVMEDNNYPDYNDLGYSSQASSIFFGGDLNPAAAKPKTRTIALRPSQESDEEDC